MSESEFLRQLDVFSQEEETGQQYFFAYLAIHKTAGTREEILRALNLAPLMWLLPIEGRH